MLIVALRRDYEKQTERRECRGVRAHSRSGGKQESCLCRSNELEATKGTIQTLQVRSSLSLVTVESSARDFQLVRLSAVLFLLGRFGLAGAQAAECQIHPHHRRQLFCQRAALATLAALLLLTSAQQLKMMRKIYHNTWSGRHQGNKQLTHVGRPQFSG